jgi:Ig-like domain CHU_C associated
MKCRAAVLLVCVLTAAGAAAQSGTNGAFNVSDPTQIFGTGITTSFNSNNAVFSIDFQEVNAQGKLTFFHFHTDSTGPTANGNWLLTFTDVDGMGPGSFTVDTNKILATLSGPSAGCSAQVGSTFSFGTLSTDSGGNVNQINGSYNFTCSAGQQVSGTFNFTAPVGSGGGGGGTGGSGGGGGSASAGVGKIPGLGTLPFGPGVSVTPVVPPSPVVFVSAPTAVIDLNSGETAAVKVTTAGNESLASAVALSATGPAGMTFAFNPPTIAAPGSGSSTLTIGTAGGVQVGDQRVEILARAPGGVTARTTVRLRVFCDPALILGIDQPRSTSIANGKTATLTVNATGSGPFTYQWYEGHRGSLVFPIAGATSATFTTPALTSGTEYWVRVSNPCGSADSQNAVVNVTP